VSQKKTVFVSRKDYRSVRGEKKKISLLKIIHDGNVIRMNVRVGLSSTPSNKEIGFSNEYLFIDKYNFW
jgi:hypothetical protein